ncbi:MAG: hypothetical protein ACK49X_02310, partial [Akkermansiaceae bacterium]
PVAQQVGSSKGLHVFLRRHDNGQSDNDPVFYYIGPGMLPKQSNTAVETYLILPLDLRKENFIIPSGKDFQADHSLQHFPPSPIFNPCHIPPRNPSNSSNPPTSVNALRTHS